MSISRRKLITTGLTVAGVSGLAAATSIAKKFGLVPPDAGGLWGSGETLTYAAQRLIAPNSMAREFSRRLISQKPFANDPAPPNDEFKRRQLAGWTLSIEGMVAHPTTFSLADLRALPVRSQITEVVCEEGWSYIAEWIGTPLSGALHECGVAPQAKYIVYYSTDPSWWETADMNDALHPQTFLAYAMNDGDLSVPFGGPLRLRVPRQLGYKSVKYVTRIVVTDSLKTFGKGVGGADPESGYAWYAGI